MSNNPRRERITLVRHGRSAHAQREQALSRQAVSKTSGRDQTSGPHVWSWTGDEIYRGSSLLADVTSTGTRHFVLDHLGSPRLITDGSATGNPLTNDFSAFGIGGMSGSGPLQFTGHERDFGREGARTLDYMHARYYSASTSRYLSMDPAPANPAKPQTWNAYLYVANQPVNFLDRTGAYRTDFHRDVTEIIALAVGYSPAEARAIAAFTELPDHDERNPESVFNFTDRASSHFVSSDRLAAMEVDAVATRQPYMIGSFLHALQDSFSHSGYGPGIGHIGPMLRGLADDVISTINGSPTGAGTAQGFDSAYKVDTTSARPGLALKAAGATYNALAHLHGPWGDFV